MRVIPPITITDSNLVSTNVAENEHPTWDVATTYAQGDKVIYAHKIYESVNGGNLGNQPDTGAVAEPPTWTDLGATNAWAMFDASVETQTENSGTIEVEFDFDLVADAVALFNVSGSTAQIIVTDDVEGEVYNRTVNLINDDEITDWYAYFFTEVEADNKLVCNDLPLYGTANIEVIVDAGAGTAKVGAIALGSQKDLGTTDYGTTVGIVDYSKRTRDEFGALQTVQRGFSDRVEYDVSVDTAKVTSVKRALTALRGVNTVFIGEESQGATVVYGIYNDFSINYTNYAISQCSITVEGLV